MIPLLLAAAGAAFAYNFANPFSGTHFGHPRLVSFRVKLLFPRGDYR